MPQGPRDLRRRRPRIQNDHLTLRHKACGCRSNAKFLLAVQFLFFVQSGVFQGSLASWQSAAMSAVNLAVDMENLQVLTNRDLRSFELLCQICYKNSTFSLQNVKDGAPALLVQQVVSCGTLHVCP